MTTTGLIILAAIFVYLAYDAHKLGSKTNELEFGIDEQMRDRPLHERNQAREWAKTHGLGNSNQLKWLFVVLAVGCVLAALVGSR